MAMFARSIFEPWQKTPHLELAVDGQLSRILRDDDGEFAGYEDLGPIDSDPKVPPDLEPERAELLDAWRSADSRRDLRSEALATYRRAATRR